MQDLLKRDKIDMIVNVREPYVIDVHTPSLCSLGGTCLSVRNIF
jgi:hypothetical protein